MCQSWTLEECHRKIPQELTFAALCMIHNEEALKNFKYDGNESTYSVHISDHTDS